jgi:hypothetical protein
VQQIIFCIKAGQDKSIEKHKDNGNYQNDINQNDLVV